MARRKSLSLSPDQEDALNQILSWYKKGRQNKQYISLGGYAGTGKTTLIAILRESLHKTSRVLKVGFASYTGKAARVLRTKLNEQKVKYPQDSVGTIHSLIYSPILDKNEEIIGWKRKDKVECELVIIDEASMVDETIWSHLLSYHVPIVLVGDHGQLPPIKGKLNLMQSPDLTLVNIHRQAEKDPIIEISHQARQSGLIKYGRYSRFVKKYDSNEGESQELINDFLSNYNKNTMVLCGYNHTRRKLNNFIRSALGFVSSEPVAGDRVICLRNNHTKEIYNGMLGTILKISDKSKNWYFAEIAMDDKDEVYKGSIFKEQFDNDGSLSFSKKRPLTKAGDLFDFGYALTVHKAQGSQAKRVILFEERFRQMDEEQWRRWLYTAVTRAEKELYIFA
jgi:exodeoxyribonuclease-5